jgi:hypothetical protein
MTKYAGNWTGVWFAGYALSGYSNQFTYGFDYGKVDLTGFQEVENGAPGQLKTAADITAMLDPADNASFEALSTPGGILERVLMIAHGNYAAPAIGDAVFCMTATQFTHNLALATRAAVIQAINFESQDDLPDLGVLHAAATITETTVFAVVNNGAQSLAGGAAYLEIMAALAADTYAIIVEDSINGTTGWATIATFTLDASAIGSQRIGIAGTIKQYTRVTATRTGSAGNSLPLVAALARH